MVHGLDRTKDNLIYKCEFYDFGDQAIDAWGTQDLYIVDCDFHDSNSVLNNEEIAGSPVWTKGGSARVWWLNNSFHDLIVNVHALNLGGCCWNNWDDIYDEQGNLKPVSEDVVARDNVLENIKIISDYPWRGAIGTQGSRGARIENNTVRGATSGIGVRKTRNNEPLQIFYPQNTTVIGNHLEDIWSGEFCNYPDPGMNLISDYNTFVGAGITPKGKIQFRAKNKVVNSLSAWQAMGFDLHSTN